MTRVKICGITNEADAHAAIDAGADALGFILYPPSPRYIAPAVAWEFISHLPPFVQRVAVVVNISRSEFDEIRGECDFDVWQFHGDETVEQLGDFAYEPMIKVIKAIRLDEAALARDYSEYPVDAWLLDTPSAVAYGGTGETFDWNLALKFREKFTQPEPYANPLLLSGGLTPENVAGAIKTVRPYGVDVSSGIESTPGKKDHAKLRDFIQICKSL